MPPAAQDVADELALVEVERERMLDLAAKYPGKGYERSAYRLIPQFVNRIPIEEFVTAIRTHPNEAIRSQAAISVQLFDGFEAVRDQVLVGGALLQFEQRYPDVFETALSALKTYGKAGSETLFNLCEHPELEFKRAALDEALRLSDMAYADHFIKAEQSADGSLRAMASDWL